MYTKVQQFLKDELKYNYCEIETFSKIASSCKIDLDAYLEGKVNGSNYTEQQQDIILKDLLICINFFKVNEDKYNSSLNYHSTAGASGNGKSFFIEMHYKMKPKKITNANGITSEIPVIDNHDNLKVYICPDKVFLPFLSIYTDFGEKNAAAYNKARDASNFLANFMLVCAIFNKKSIIHGTTATSEKIIDIYNVLHSYGYNINITVLFASSSQRQNACNQRSQEIIQVSIDDFNNKAKLVFSRMQTYLNYGDTVTCYIQQGAYWQGQGELKCFASKSVVEVDGTSTFLVSNAENYKEFLDILKIEAAELHENIVNLFTVNFATKHKLCC